MLHNIKRILEVVCLVLIFCMGCMLFKKSTKSTTETRSENQVQAYLERVNLKTSNRETNIYTYWNDSSVFQYQNVRENIEVTKHNTVNKNEKQVTQQKEMVKKTEPPDLWVYGVIVVVVVGVLILVVKFWWKSK